ACLCPACRAPYHRECWNEVGGCAIYGCRLMPAARKAEQDSAGRSEGWGDDKVCPRCGKQIRSAAVRCRFCRAEFPSAMPMNMREYQDWTQQQAQLKPTRTLAIVLFAVSLIGFLAPILVAAGVVWALNSRDALRRAGGFYQVMCWFGIILSVIYTLIMCSLLF
ncbi:MAG TPA: hypothetical protein VM141_09210, partial [Planctomycetota bacterium]|nr:hypothetical protein [Planctomycetota bacterium]